MHADRKEVLRYLRMGNARPEATLSERIDAVEREVVAAARPLACSEIIPADELGFASSDLRRILAGCDRACLLAATLGAGVDALLRRRAAASAVDALIAQAVATTLIESHLDDCEERLRRDTGARGLAPRFSPGYGDLPLAAGRAILERLDATRKIGVALTDTLLMVPSKSVTAIIGIKT